MKKSATILATILLALYSLDVRGNNATHIGLDDNLSNLFIVAMDQESSGNMWFASEYGLNRYNGVEVTPIFSYDSELASNEINDIYVDRDEPYVWIATKRSGLNRYNTSTKEFELFTTIKDEVHSISGNSIIAIDQSPSGEMWFVSYTNGVNRFDKQSGHFHRYNKHNIKGFPSAPVRTFAIGDDGSIFIGHSRRGLTIFNPLTESIERFYHIEGDPESLPSNDILSLYCDPKGRIWIGTTEGLALFNPQNRRFVRYRLQTAQADNIAIYDIKQRKNGEMLVATEFYGVYRLDPTTQQFTQPREYREWRSKTIRTLYEDDYENVWLGSYGDGVGFVSAQADLFDNLTLGSPLTFENAWGLTYDKEGNLWVGTDGGGVDVVRSGEVVRSYREELSSRAVLSAMCDSEGRIWLGTFTGGLNIYDPQSDTFYCPPLPSGSKDIRCFFEDGDRVYVGSDSGVDIISKRDLKPIYIDNKESDLPTRGVRAIAKDRYSNLWIGTYGSGVTILDKGLKRIRTLQSSTGDIPSNIITDLHLDSQGVMWVAGERGVVYFEPTKEIISAKGNLLEYTQDRQIMAITEDREGYIWFSNSTGIYQANHKNDSVHHYGFDDGIVMGNFMSGSIAQSAEGSISFGSTGGVTSFDPRRFNLDVELPKVQFRSLQLLGNATLNSGIVNSIAISERIILNYDENNFRLLFSTPNFALLNRIEYVYRIIGLDNEWYSADERGCITIRHLPYGEYVVEVKARLRNGDWSREVSSFQLCITPPLYLSWWAKSLYLIAILALSYLLFRVYSQHAKQRMNLAYEREKINEQQKINDERLRFYTNITHELRTPLTLILGPLENLQEDNTLSHKNARKVDIAHQSASQLLVLINQLLEFRKTETQNKNLVVGYGNLSAKVAEVGQLFRDSNENPEVEIVSDSDREIKLMFDSEIITIILNNLISNAMKYTPKGRVVIATDLVEVDGENLAEITISDSGYGIPSELLERIFERYYQVDNKHQASGTGIGLALVKSLVTLHQATIDVESTLNVGTTFRLRLDVANNYGSPKENLQLSESVSEQENSDQRPLVLIVDDNHTICEYIEESLCEEYRTIVRYNGEDGYIAATTSMPNIIISDVMMPIMDGVEMCHKIKTDIRTSHIPIILLTAKSSNEARGDGYDAGVDSYITKPFNIKILNSRIKNLLDNRRRIAKIISSVQTPTKEVERAKCELSPIDSEFLQSVTNLIVENISLEEVDVQFLAERLFMSHSTLYRKIKSVTGISINELIRRLRMRRAAEMLSDQDVSIKEVAYSVGISSFTYFRKSFKNEYGVSPTDYKKGIRGSN